MTVWAGDSETHRLTIVIRTNTDIGQSAGVRMLRWPCAIHRKTQNTTEKIIASGRNLVEMKLIATQSATISNSIEVIQVEYFFTLAMRLS